MGYQKVLVALDRSPQGQILFDTALQIARQDGAALMLFHSLPVETQGMTPYTNIYGEELMNFSQSIREQIEKDTKETQEWLAQLCQKATEQGIATEWDWKIGDAGRWVCDVAHAWSADLIIIGRRGLRGFAEMFLGSVSNYVIHHARCSVLVVQGDKLA
jgi:nucleotide-binding universal stress UspA family protein